MLRFSKTLIPLVAGFALLLGGCIERSVVVKVKQDGSGLLHLRSHTQEAIFSFGSSEDDEESKTPSDAWVQKTTKMLGADAKLVSITQTTNRSGWSGFDAIWEFDDISQLVLPGELLNTDEKKKESQEDVATEAAEDLDQGDKDEKKKAIDSGYTFAMQDGVLEIKPYGQDRQEEKKETPAGAVDPFAGAPPASNPSGSFGELATEQLLSKVLADMRIGIFVEVDGQIRDSNAKHRTGNLVTLIDIEVGKLLESPETKARLKRLGKEPPTPAQIQELADQVEGLKIDLQDPIRITIK